MKIGFVGTGTITAAVVRGLLLDKSPVEWVIVSPRNDAIARRLAALDSRVRVAKSNQDVLDHVDVICLAVRPQIASQVLCELKFRQSHHVISFIATLSYDAVKDLVAPATQVVRAVPLPAVAQRMGVTAICPPDTTARELFSLLGEAIEVETAAAFNAFSAITATMGGYFALLEAQANWLTSHELAPDVARKFLSQFYLGLANASCLSDVPFSELKHEFMTEGGLNEQLHKDLDSQGLYRGYGEALERVLNRVRDTSDSRNDPAKN